MPRNLNDGDLDRYIKRVADDIASCGLGPNDRRTIAIHLLKWPGKRIYFDQLVPPAIRKRTEPQVGAQIASVCLNNGLLVPQKRTAFIKVGSLRIPKGYAIYPESLDRTDPVKVCGIARNLDNRITVREPNFFVFHPAVFDAYRSRLEDLSNWLGKRRETAAGATLKQRSYEIWGDEKMLQSRAPGMKDPFGLVLTKCLHLDIYRLLKINYDSGDDFEAFILPGSGSVVVSENRDMYHDIRNMLQGKGPFRLCGETVRGTVFGEGRRVLEQEFGRFLESSSIGGTDVLYIGDIDRAGLWLLDQVRTHYGFRSFAGLYSLMAVEHMNRRERGLPLNEYGDVQPEGIDMSRLSDAFQPWATFEIARCMNESIRIPQEIISRPQLERSIERHAE